MKRSITNKKEILLTQTGLALIFFLSSGGLASAASALPAQSVQIAQASPVESIEAPAPAAAAPAAPSISAPAPAAPAATTKTPSVPPVAQTLPAATKTEAASQPPSKDLAVAHNPEEQGQPAATAPEKKHSAHKEAKENKEAKGNNGLKVTDMLATPAHVRPLPTQYLVVKKDHNANDPDAHLTAARSALAQGNYQAALELFDDLYRKSPRDMRVIMGRAVALQKLGQNDEAMDAYQVALRTDPRNIEALTNMLGLLRGKDAPTALKKLQQLRDLYPANADVTAQLGMVYGVSGDYNNAIKYLNMADALKPGNPTVLYNKAVAYDHMGNTAQAAELYRQILLLANDGDLDRSFPLEVVRQRLATLR